MTWFILFWLLLLTWWIIKIDIKQITQGHQIRDIKNQSNKHVDYKIYNTYNNKGKLKNN